MKQLAKQAFRLSRSNKQKFCRPERSTDICAGYFISGTYISKHFFSTEHRFLNNFAHIHLRFQQDFPKGIQSAQGAQTVLFGAAGI